MRTLNPERSLPPGRHHELRAAPRPYRVSPRADVPILEPSDLTTLTSFAARPAHVSLFTPQETCGTETAQNLIRWKNLLARTEAALRDVAQLAEVDATLAAVRRVTPERLFAAPPSTGLAVFARPGWSRCFQVPAGVPELSAVGDRFLVAPLLDIVSPSQRFLLLVLNQSVVRLFAGTRFGLDEIPTARLPSCPATSSERRRRDVTDRAGALPARRTGSRAGAIFHGGGSVGQQRHEATLRYFRAVDALLPDFASLNRPPLLLAGPSHLISLYRQLSRYPAMLDSALPMSPARLSIGALHRMAWTRVERQFRRAEKAAARRYRDLAGTGLTMSEPADISAAARAGRIDALFIAASTFTRPTSTRPPVLRLAGGTSSVADQLDHAAAGCLAYGGTVHLVPAERMPVADDAGRRPAAALLRF